MMISYGHLWITETLQQRLNSKFAPALLRQKELFTILNFAVWKKVFKMSI